MAGTLQKTALTYNYIKPFWSSAVYIYISAKIDQTIWQEK
jgi:hypothetical protein